jgi:exosortase C (VPDSG-CTERM-specific)
MSEPDKISAQAVSAGQDGRPPAIFRWSGPFVWATLALIVCYSRPLYQLARFAIASELFSHILLVPFISLYLVWTQRSVLPPSSAPDRRIAVPFLLTGALLLAGYWAGLFGTTLARDDTLALTTLSFLLFFGGICGLFLGRQTLRAIVFPLGLLLFMVPFPVLLQTRLETLLQHGSANAAYAMIKAAGTPVFRENLIFKLPGITLEVAPQCSGLHSTLALFITSLLAGHFFLRTTWKRAVLTLFVIPLAVLRNGFRIFTLGELCVHVSPDMIDTPIHHHGGPLFFILSLIPFFLLLRVLYKSEVPGKNTKS